MRKLVLTLASIACICSIVSANYRYMRWDFVCKEGGEIVGRMHLSPSGEQSGSFRVEYRGEAASGTYRMSRPVQVGEVVPITYHLSDGRQTRGEHVWTTNGTMYVSFDGICFDVSSR